MHSRIHLSIFAASLAFSAIISAEETKNISPSSEVEKADEKSSTEEKWDSEKRQAALRVQLFLDAKGFGPGKIDGYWGGFSEKAAVRWNEADNGTPITILEDGSLDHSEAASLPLPGDLFTTYTISPDDEALLGSLPEDPAEKAKLDHLPYETLMEVVSEKFHSDPEFIVEVNGLDSADDLKTGMELKVPNVAEPFDIKTPMDMAKKSSEKKKEGDDSETSEPKGEESAPIQLAVLRDKRIVEVREDDKLIHSFPISPGANDNQSPAGDWEVAVVSWMPEFRWDKAMLEDGTRSNDSHLLPSGPNNPVGIVWIGLTADGIGLHGTPYPDAIGRNRSHGCIRLSNWDALKLAKIVETGTPVMIK